MTLQIFSAWVSDSEPPKTVKSWREDEDQAAVDGAVTDDDAVARGLFGLVHAEVDAAVLLEHVPFFEGTRIEQQLDAFAGRQLALGVLAVDTLLATAEAGQLHAFFPAGE